MSENAAPTTETPAPASPAPASPAPASPMPDTMTFSVSHADPADFKRDGLRPFFEYRDLGIRAATGGKANAHVIRARPGEPSHGGWHTHDLNFQMVYVLRGWVKFAYEGVGEVLLQAGSCVHQPPGIRHVEIAHSDDLEMLEITLPAEFPTAGAEPPDAP